MSGSTVRLGRWSVVCRWSGWPDSNRRPRRPERRALPAAPQPVVGVRLCVVARRLDARRSAGTPSSGGRTRSPISWFRARCAAHCTTPEWGLRTLDPHAAHRRGRASPEIRTPIRGVRARSVSRYRRDAGVRAERVELSMDSVHRGLSPARLPVPPRPHEAPRRLPRCCGPRRARTVTSLHAGELHCLSCSGPVVRGAGVEPAEPEGAWVTARCRPVTASRGWTGGTPRQDMARPRSAYWRSLQFSRIYLGATGGAHIEIQASHTRRGAGNRTPPTTVLETVRLPVPHPSGIDAVVFGPEKQKSRLQLEAAPERSSDL
jgi:hypothetical protein